MDKRRLGATDIEVTPIGLGCWQFSQGASRMGRVWDTISQETITAVVETAMKGGISWFDTAEMYGRGRSERNLSAALARLSVKPGSVVVATKWFPFLRWSRSIAAAIDARIACLGQYPIDLYQIHHPWSFSPIPAQMKEMAKLLRAGKIRSISTCWTETLKRAACWMRRNSWGSRLSRTPRWPRGCSREGFTSIPRPSARCR